MLDESSIHIVIVPVSVLAYTCLLAYGQQYIVVRNRILRWFLELVLILLESGFLSLILARSGRLTHDSARATTLINVISDLLSVPAAPSGVLIWHAAAHLTSVLFIIGVVTLIVRERILKKVSHACITGSSPRDRTLSFARLLIWLGVFYLGLNLASSPTVSLMHALVFWLFVFAAIFLPVVLKKADNEKSMPPLSLRGASCHHLTIIFLLTLIGIGLGYPNSWLENPLGVILLSVVACPIFIIAASAPIKRGD
jgi:hypothetical protein